MYAIYNDEKIYLKLNDNGYPIVCSESEKHVFEYSKAKNIVDNLPRALKKLNFRVVVIMSNKEQQILDDYCSKDMKKLKRISYVIFKRFGGISEKDHDDFYSIASAELWKAIKRYDESKNVSFEEYLELILKNKFKTEMTRRNRNKRCVTEKDENGETIYVPTLSIDAPIGEKDSLPHSETIPSGFKIENELSEEIGLSFGEKVENFLEELPLKVQKIARLISQGYEKVDIVNILHIEEKQYLDALKTMRQTEYISILY